MEARRSYTSDDSPDQPITCDHPITRSQYLCHRERTESLRRLLPNLLRSSAGTSGGDSSAAPRFLQHGRITFAGEFAIAGYRAGRMCPQQEAVIGRFVKDFADCGAD